MSSGFFSLDLLSLFLDNINESLADFVGLEDFNEIIQHYSQVTRGLLGFSAGI